MDFIIKPSFKDMLIRGFNDRIYFINEILEEEVHPGQIKALKGIEKAHTSYLSCGNRFGKGEVACFDGAWHCMYKDVDEKFKNKKLSALNSSVSQDQANIILDKFIERCASKKKYAWMIQDIKHSPFPHVIFKNGITWWFRNASQDGKFLEGRSYFFANFDEVDLQRNAKRIIDDVIKPRLWDYNGKLTIMGTPRRGKKNAYGIWKEMLAEEDQSQVFNMHGDSRLNTFLHHTAVEKMTKLPTRLLNQNVLGLFEDSDSPIPADIVDYCEQISTGLTPVPSETGIYVNGWDLARSSTWCTCATIDVSQTPFQLVHFLRFKEDKKTEE